MTSDIEGFNLKKIKTKDEPHETRWKTRKRKRTSFKMSACIVKWYSLQIQITLFLKRFSHSLDIYFLYKRKDVEGDEMKSRLASVGILGKKESRE